MIGNNFYGGGSGGSTEKIQIANIPFTNDITDTLGNLNLTYTSGGTPLTCDENGFYMYTGELTISDFSSLINNYVEFEMQVQYENTGTSSYPLYRRILWTDTVGSELTSDSRKLITITAFGVGNLVTAVNDYRSTDYHNLIIRYNYAEKTIYFQIDLQEGHLIHFDNLVKTTLFRFNHERYGLNGHIRNLKVYVDSN